MNKCERGHYYDENKFSKCPVCDEDMNKKILHSWNVYSEQV